MELSAVLSLRDKLSAQMNKAGKSVSAMTAKVNESRDAITRISRAQNIQINARCNISELVNTAKASISSLQSTISDKELVLEPYLNDENFGTDTINQQLEELGGFLDKNAGKFDEYSNKLAVLKQKQNEFTDSTKGSTKLGVEQSIESLERKLAEIETAKQKFAEWQQIKMDFNELEEARSELATLERAVDDLNHTNVAVRAYVDFKDDALKQVYDIDEKFKELGRRIAAPVINVKDQATAKISSLKEKGKAFAREKFAPVLSAVDKTKSVMGTVRSGLAKIAGTVAYPLVKLKDLASPVASSVKEKLNELKEKIVPVIKMKAQEAFNTIKELGEKIAGLGAKAGKAVGGAMKTIAKGTAIALTGAATIIGGVGAAAINTGSQFEASMSQVAATMGMTADEASYSNEEYAKLANTAKQMGATTKFSASEAGEALNFLALAGYDADKACAALPTILNLAAAGGMDLAAASDMVTDSMSALGIAATEENLTNFGDQLAKTAQKSNTSVSQLGEAILTVGGTAKTLAGGTTELNALLGIIADNGVKGAEGGTKLRNIMLSLQSPTDVAAKRLKALGVSVYDAQGKMRPMNEVLGDLNTSMSNMTDAEKQNALSTIFNKADLKSVNALLDNCGTRFDELSGYIADSDGAMQDMADTMNNNLQGRVTEFKSAMEGAGIAIYEAIGSGNLKDIVKEAGGWVTELTKATEEGGIDGLVNAIGGVFAKVITKVSTLAPQLITMGIGMVESFIAGIQANLPAIISGLTKTGTVFLQGVLTLMPKLVIAGTQLLIQLAQGLASELPTILTVGLQAVQELAQGIADNTPLAITTAVTILTTLVNGISRALPSLAQSALAIIRAIAQGIINNLPAIAAAGITLLSSLAQGILDTVPVLLETGMQLIMALADTILQMAPSILATGLQLIMALADGLVQSIPTLIDSAVQIVMGLISFISANLPMILQAALSIITTLVQGLISNIPLIINGAIQILVGLVNFIISNLPLILQTAVQIIVTLALGLIQAIPELLSAIPQLIAAIVDTILNTNWLDVGWQIIKGIGSGLLNGIKSLFGCGDEAAEDVIAGLESGIDEGIPTVSAAATNMSDSVTTSMQPDLALVQGYGTEAGNSLAAGINSSTAQTVNAASNSALTTAGAFSPVINTSEYGSLAGANLANGIDAAAGLPVASAENLALNTTNSLNGITDTTALGTGLSTNLATGINSGSGEAIAAAAGLTNQVQQAANADVIVNVSANADGLQSFNTAITAAVTEATNGLKTLPTSAKETWNQVSAAFEAGTSKASKSMQLFKTMAVQCLVQLNLACAAGMIPVNATVVAGMDQVVSTIGGVSLYGSGRYLMMGLNNGMLSMRGSLMAAARSIAESISGTINKSLDIHSPSRVTTKSGRFAAKGVIVGMKQEMPAAIRTAEDFSEAIARPLELEEHNSTQQNYEGLEIAQPVSNSTANYTSSTSSQTTVKKYYIDKIIGEVTVTGEGDEDRLVEKILAALADDIDETADNMGEGDED